jgi:hypothetical protein
LRRAKRALFEDLHENVHANSPVKSVQRSTTN